MRIHYCESKDAEELSCPHCWFLISYQLLKGNNYCFPHFYCDSCSNIIHRDSDLRLFYEEAEDYDKLLLKIASTLPKCPCGGRFTPKASPKCPACKKNLSQQHDPLMDLNAMLLESACFFTDTNEESYRLKIKRGFWGSLYRKFWDKLYKL